MLAPEGNVLSLTVAVPASLSLDAGGRDLDNYLLPIARRLGHARFVSAWAAKEHRERSLVSVGRAQAAPHPDGSWRFAGAETTEPKASPAWKRDIDAQMRRQVHERASGPVELQISYVVEPRWNWTELWKPTIDALGAILGDGRRPFHPLDDRIVLLGLHRRAQHRASRSTTLRVWWRPATRPGV